MAMGLGSLRLPPSAIDGGPDEDDIEDRFPPKTVDLDEDEIAPDPNTSMKVEIGDGSVVVYLGPQKKKKEDSSFDDNLAEILDEGKLGQIADELLRLIDSDDTARKEWLETRARGVELLGLRIEPMRSGVDEGSAPLEGMSNIRSSTLSEAVVRFNANAFAELCPADGPVKVTQDQVLGVRSDDNVESDALEKLLNHYLMVVDKPWVPDTDAALLRVPVDGSVFKKIYHDPILRRPVSRTVLGEDIILDSAATSLYDAKRITHRIFMDKSTIKRMQIVKAYRKTELGNQGFMTKNAQDEATDEIAGIQRFETRDWDDKPYELFECLCELDIPGFEHESDGRPDGLAVPYKVVILKEARTCLEIRRNWSDGDDLCLPKQWYEQFCFIRGFGPYGIGLSHLMGNITAGLTAISRELVDAGMFANFPAFLIRKGALRQEKNIMRGAPGQGIPIETGDMPINQVASPLPYKGADPVFVSFMQQLEQNAQRLGGTAEVMVGEGRQDAPVGTTLALIEQAIKPLMGTHKRLCAAQSAEIQMLVERFREDPQSFIRSLKKIIPPEWNEDNLLKILDNFNYVTRADPNTASHLQRMLRYQALYQMAVQNPGAFDNNKVYTDALRGIGFAQPEVYLNQNTQAPPPDPKAIADQMSAQADMIDAQEKAKQGEFDRQNSGQQFAGEQAANRTKLAVAGMQLDREKLVQQGESQRHMSDKRQEAQQNQLDRAHEMALEMRKQAAQMQTDHMQRQHEAGMAQAENQHALQQAQTEHAHAVHEAGMQNAHEAQQANVQHAHDLQQTHVQGQHAMNQAALTAANKPQKPGNKP